MKNYLLISLSMVLVLSSLIAQADEATQSWSEFRAEILQLTRDFRSSQLTRKQKIKLLPKTNQVLSLMQDLEFSARQKQDQVETTIELLAAASDIDFANSTTDTVYFDYKTNKKLYKEAISRLSSQEEKETILESFKDWEEFEKNPEEM